MPTRPRSRSFPIVVTALGFVLVIGAVLGGVYYITNRPSALDRFYRPPAGYARQPRGEVLRQEPVAAGPDVRARRVLYRTESVDGRPAAASGFVAWPAGPPPPGGFPIVAFGHATVGLADECAPSRLGLGRFNRKVITSFLASGFAVAGADYPGLGPPDDPHPYLVGPPSGASVIDIVRAAREINRDLLSNRVVAWGASQGAHAVLWARAEVADDAPELDWRGTVALAPIVDLTTLSGSRELGQVLTVAMLMGQATKGVNVRPALTEAGLEIRDTLASDCFDEAVRDHIEDGRPTLITNDRSWVESAAEDAPPTAGEGPVLIVYGSRDDTIGIDAVKAWAAAAGPTVTVRELDGVDHGGVVSAVGNEDRGWMLEQLAREPS